MCSPQRSQVILRYVVGGIVRGYHGRIVRHLAIRNDSSAGLSVGRVDGKRFVVRADEK
jgi:hypothetical protein